MPSPFPGMDPYLESPQIWPDVHHELISQIRSALNPVLRPAYVARVELRVYISDDEDPGRRVIVPDLRVEKSAHTHGKKSEGAAAVAVIEPLPLPYTMDEEIHEARLEIYHRESASLVTIIEVLSPANKVRRSRGRESLMEKRRDARAAGVHWVEIDLLRAGKPTIVWPPLEPCDYRILMYRAGKRGHYWPISIRQPLPPIGIPLRDGDADVPLDLNAVLRSAYDHAAYDLSIDYTRAPEVALTGADKSWAEELLRTNGLR